jgi:hypothetical protein
MRSAPWLRHLAPALLVAVAAVQAWTVRTTGLSPWLGGGFGMFSTTDSWARRHLHAWAVSPGVRRELDVAPEVDPLARAALAEPTAARLRRLAVRLAAGAPADVTVVEIQVWAPRFDPETLAPSSVLLRAIEVPVGPG